VAQTARNCAVTTRLRTRGFSASRGVAFAGDSRAFAQWEGAVRAGRGVGARLRRAARSSGAECSANKNQTCANREMAATTRSFQVQIPRFRSG
jgi:hypothetical protein